MTTVGSSTTKKGAAICVALFVCPPLAAAAWPTMNAWLDLIPAASAKMRQDRLTIASANGSATHSFAIEVAATEKEKALGLMFRTELSDGQGMLFPYAAERNLQMWMHNTYIPLDMLFIRADGTIARIEERAEPLSDRVISSGSPVLAVLEIPGGAAGRLGIKTGDKVSYHIFSAANSR
ncbi:MAG: DUF192 domain-containing protein [Proteobacteria bacterium]|nr:DUF192 domain-containing protein [Pseudomonadota bacterium]